MHCPVKEKQHSSLGLRNNLKLILKTNPFIYTFISFVSISISLAHPPKVIVDLLIHGGVENIHVQGVYYDICRHYKTNRVTWGHIVNYWWCVPIFAFKNTTYILYIVSGRAQCEPNRSTYICSCRCIWCTGWTLWHDAILQRHKQDYLNIKKKSLREMNTFKTLFSQSDLTTSWKIL